MEFTPQSIDSKRVRETMRVLSYEEAKAGVSRVIEKPLQEKGALIDWDLSFSEYIEEHKNSKLLFCWYAQGVAIVFSPGDHHGVWAMQREGIKGKGILPEYALMTVEGIAKEKALA